MSTLIIFVLLFLAVPWAWAAEGQWAVCNRLGKDVVVGIAYVNPGSRGAEPMGVLAFAWFEGQACPGVVDIPPSFR